MSERMCPCGNCRSTWDRAVLDLMHVSKLSRDQAEAHLEAMVSGNHQSPEGEGTR